MTKATQEHVPVLLDETVNALNIKPDGLYIDGTFGRGGHTRAILEELSSKGRVLGLDKDPEALKEGQNLAAKDERFTIEQCSFETLSDTVKTRFWQGKVDGVLLDIGVSSPQLDIAERGFSFQKDGPLDMRMNPGEGESAAEWLAHASMDEITTVLKTLGEERFSKRIARAIIETRDESPLRTTKQLADLVDKASPFREKNKHPATRTFQAVRIHINNELGELSGVLQQAIDVMAIGGRLTVISFHSLEDRIVKRFFREQAKGDDLPAHFPITADQLNPSIKLIGKAIKSGQQELTINPRSRSAILRVVEKIK